jgi:hypothetical protein
VLETITKTLLSRAKVQSVLSHNPSGVRTAVNRLEAMITVLEQTNDGLHPKSLQLTKQSPTERLSQYRSLKQQACQGIREL